MIRILYFAGLVNALGRSSEELELPSGVSEVGGLLQWLALRGERWAQALQPGRVMVTVNRRFADPDTPLQAGDEVGLVGRGA
jgi:sulfur-carrier protein